MVERGESFKADHLSFMRFRVQVHFVDAWKVFFCGQSLGGRKGN